MNEASLKRALVKALKTAMPGCVVFCHEDKFTGGIPDISLTWAGATSWIEVKYHRPGRRGKLSALQALTLDRIARAGGNARLLEYTLQKDGAWITTLRPRVTAANHGFSVAHEGRAHAAVVEGLVAAHLRLTRI